MVAQLVQDLLHLEGGKDGLNQDCRPDGSARNAELVLGEVEDVVPQPRLEVALELRQVEVRPAALLQQPLGVVEEVEPEVEQAARDRLAIHFHVAFIQVPPTRPDEQRRHLLVEPVLLAFRALELDAPLNGVDEVGLALDQVRPRR